MKYICAFLIFYFAAFQAWGCYCDSPQTVKEIIDVPGIAHIFKGKVIKVVHNETRHTTEEIITFKILENYRGQQAKEITVEFISGISSCHLRKPAFKIDDIYQISTYEVDSTTDNPGNDDPQKEIPSDRYTNNFCSLRKKIFPATPNSGNINYHPE